MRDGKYWHDGPMRAAFDFIGICILVTWVLVILNIIGCNRVQRDAFRNSVVDVSDCAFHTSVGCASQALTGCQTPTGGAGYGEFGECLVEKSASCSGRGLGMCLLRGIVNVAGTLSVGAGGVGCAGDESVAQVKACVQDVTMETEAEAVGAVAACYRRVCMEGRYASEESNVTEEAY